MNMTSVGGYCSKVLFSELGTVVLDSHNSKHFNSISTADTFNLGINAFFVIPAGYDIEKR